MGPRPPFTCWSALYIIYAGYSPSFACENHPPHRPPLIRMTGLRRVVEAAVDDYGKIEGWTNDRDKEVRRTELNRSIARANDILSRVSKG